MYIRIGGYFVDVLKISTVRLVTHYDQREEGSWKTLRIEFEEGTDIKSLELSEAEARKSPFLNPFLAEPGVVNLSQLLQS